MNKTVQRIVTLLLVLLLTCGMFPAAFATDAAPEDTLPAEPTEVVPDPTEPTLPAESQEETETTEPTEPEEPVPKPPEVEDTSFEETVVASPVFFDTGSAEEVPMLMALDDGIMLAAATSVTGTHYQRAIVWLTGSEKINFTYNGKDYSVNRLYTHGVIVDGKRYVAYCIDPGVDTTQSSGGYTGSESAWSALDINTQSAVGLAILYGAPNKLSSTDKKTMLTYELATQIIVQEIILGFRNNLPPYNCTDSRMIDQMTYGSSSYFREISSQSQEYSSISGQRMDKALLKQAYDTISASLASHYVLPSFASRYNAAAKTYEMTKQSDGSFAVTLTDTNGVLAKCTFKNGNGLTYSVSGNQLTIKASDVFEGTKSCALSGGVGVSKQVPNLEAETFMLWEAGSYQRIVSLQEPLNDPLPLYFNVKISAGDLEIQKNTEDGLKKKGWLFGAYSDSTCKTLIAGPAASDANGKVRFEGLTPGKVWIKELGHEDSTVNAMYECVSPNPQEVTITAGKTATVTFKNNLRYGSITFRKATTSGIGVELGWTAKLWKLESDGTQTYIGSGTTKKDKSDPTYTFHNLLPGTYILQEDPGSGKTGYTLDATAHKVTVTAGKNTTVTITNVSLGYIQIVKNTNTGKDVAGRKFNIFTDEALTKLFPGSPFTSGKDGTIVTEAPPGVYYIQEIDESAANPGWVFDTSVKKVTVKAHETASVTFTNIQQGYGQIIKDMPDGGPKADWAFDLHTASDNQYVATYTSGSDGTVNTDWLLPGEYLIYEKIPEDSLYYCESTNPQKVTIKAGEVTKVTFVNRLKPAQIEAQKTDIYTNPLDDIRFLLEWSEDGKNWKAVTYTDSKYVTRGTCTATGLSAGVLTTSDSGTVTFTGLHPEMYYRITELSTTDGKQLMAEPVFEGKIPQDNLTATVHAVNSSTFVLPHTGSSGITRIAAAAAACAVLCALFVILRRRREETAI